MAKNTARNLGIAIILLVTIAVLVVSIITLVKVSNHKEEKVNPTTPAPIQSTKPSRLPNSNIPQPKRNDSPSFKNAAKILEEALDTSFDPCEDFYNYTCARFSGDSFNDLQKVMLQAQIEAESEPLKESDPHTVKLHKQFLDICEKGLSEPLTDDAILKSFVDGFKTVSKFPFPLIDGSTNNKFPTPEELGRVIAYSVLDLDTDLIFGFGFFENMKNTERGQSLIILANGYDQDYSIEFGQNETEIVQDIVNKMTLYFDFYYDDPSEWTQKIKEQAEAFFKLEKYLVATVEKEKVQNPRNMSQVFQSTNLNELNKYSSTVSVKAMVEFVVEKYPKAKRLLEDDYEIYSMQLTQAISTLKVLENILDKAKITADNFYNYLYYRIFTTRNGAYIPVKPKKEMVATSSKDTKKLADNIKPKSRLPNIMVPIRKPAEVDIYSLVDDKTKAECKGLANFYFSDSSDYLFAHYVYPNEADLVSLRTRINKMTESVALGFRSMINQVDIFTVEDRNKALKKLDFLIKNLAFPDFVLKPDLLDEDFKDFEFDDKDSFLMSHFKIGNEYRKNIQKKIEEEKLSRNDFNARLAVVNAFFNPMANAMTLPLAILNPPFFHMEFPDVVNFAAIGSIIGHEIVHGFDDTGSQFDYIGSMKDWMSDRTQQNFRKMSDCVVHQYGKFCEDGICVNGPATQGENIADSGGLEASYRAYRNWMSLKGPDSALPSDLLSQYTHDQLFFVAYSRSSCEQFERLGETEEPHAAARFRTKGSIQNFGAFRDAFNCPLGSTYAPKDHCKVYVSDFRE